MGHHGNKFFGLANLSHKTAVLFYLNFTSLLEERGEIDGKNNKTTADTKLLNLQLKVPTALKLNFY